MDFLHLRTQVDGYEAYKIVGLDGPETITATATLHLNSRQDLDDAAQLEGVYVNPDFRCRGVGKALVEKAIYLAHIERKIHVVLQVHEDNPRARRLYENAGFTEYEGPDEAGMIGAYRQIQ